MTTARKIIAFDLYGTLLSTESIAHELAKRFGDDKAQALAAKWRQYQLEYTWRINSMGEYQPFGELTRRALRHALSEQRLEIAQLDFDELMTAYNRLHVFDEVPAALQRLGQRRQAQPDDAVAACVFSNGTDDMVRSSLAHAASLGPHADVLADVVTVEEVRAFKPDRRVYEHLLQRVGKQDAHARADVWVVSANPFDIVGAKAAGLKAAFIDRAGTGWVDRLDGLREPSLIAPNVDEAVKSILLYSRHDGPDGPRGRDIVTRRRRRYRASWGDEDC